MPEEPPLFTFPCFIFEPMFNLIVNVLCIQPCLRKLTFVGWKVVSQLVAQCDQLMIKSPKMLILNSLSIFGRESNVNILTGGRSTWFWQQCPIKEWPMMHTACYVVFGDMWRHTVHTPNDIENSGWEWEWMGHYNFWPGFDRGWLGQGTKILMNVQCMVYSL